MAEIKYDQIVSIAKEAGELAMAGWSPGKAANDVWEKHPGHIVSSIDIAVNDLLQKRLQTLLPEAGWLSEETHIDRSGAGDELTWVVDPIDGTKDFVKGKSGWCISVALVKNNAPIFGVLNAPAMGELWVAKAGSHAEVNGRALVASQRTCYDGSRIPVDALPDEIDLVAVPKPNSIALRMAMVADDRADLLVSTRWGHEWDIAAAHVIAEEAGACVSDALGNRFEYDGTHGKAQGVICCSKGIYGEAVKRLEKYVEAGRKES